MQFEFIAKFLYGLFGKAYLDHFNFNDYYTSLIWITLVIEKLSFCNDTQTVWED
jgi:hypothetical protein